MPGFPPWIWACALAPFVGSFLGVVVMRHDAIATALAGRSACTACGARLGAADLVPVLSWLSSRGHCRHCGGTIALFYPVIELAALTVAAWAAASGAPLWISCALGWALLALAATDLRYFLLPDFLTLPLIAGGLLASALLDPAALAAHAIGAAAGYLFVVAVRLAYRRLRGREGMGQGDAKLLAAAGAWVSWTGLPSVLLIGALFGLAYALLRHKNKVSLKDPVPFGAFLCAGLWIVWLYGPLTAG